MMLEPFLKSRCKSKAEVFDLIVLNSISDAGSEIGQDIAKMTPKQKRNLFSGISSISRIAERIYPVLDTSGLVKVLEDTIQGDSLANFVETFSCYVGNVTKENFAQKVADQFKKIIFDSSATFRSAQLQGTATLRAQLFEEDDGICPCCGKSLSLNSADENAIVATKLDTFDSDTGRPYKMIGLCKDCANLYAIGKLDKDLAHAKERLEKKANLRKQAGTISVDGKLMSAIEILLKESKTSDVVLNMKSLKINQKVDKENELFLYNKIKSNVAHYFPNLYKLFGELDGEERRSYELLSSTIRTAFLFAEKESQNKEDIFNLLVDKVSIAGCCDKSVAEIIVSYFVQSCEVFHEISK